MLGRCLASVRDVVQESIYPIVLSSEMAGVREAEAHRRALAAVSPGISRPPPQRS
jgi:hypothetical protein